MRTILHCDLNHFYAAVACLDRPELASLPLAVCGDPRLRHGIVLAKNIPAKRYGIRTGDTIWQATKKCPQLTVVGTDFERYAHYSRLVREIYARYTDRVEPFGIDECWLDVTESVQLYGDGEAIAHQLRQAVKEELGLTISVGVSYNKVFSKLGSDLQKPDATTVISRETMREIVWPLEVERLLYVGKSTRLKLQRVGVCRIGQLAATPPATLRALLGKWGETLCGFANGEDDSEVTRIGDARGIKGIGNSITTPRDLATDEAVLPVFYLLAESVSERLRRAGLRGATLQIGIKDCGFAHRERQCSLPAPTCISHTMVHAAMALFRANWRWDRAIRALGIRITALSPAHAPHQLAFWESDEAKREQLEYAIDGIRSRFGHGCVQRAILLAAGTEGYHIAEDHVIHSPGHCT